MFNPRIYPQENTTQETFHGFYPTDFILEAIIESGLEWFRTDPSAPNEVFGHLRQPRLKERYGDAKILEITNWIKEHEIRVLQSFPIEDSQYPTISINLGDSPEDTMLTGLDKHGGELDVLDSEGNVQEREDIGYMPIQDNVLIGIHATGSPDKVKYLYYLLGYILASSIPLFEELGLMEVTFRATDLSRVLELLPSNTYSRFITFTCSSIAQYTKGKVPMLGDFKLTVRVE